MTKVINLNRRKKIKFKGSSIKKNKTRINNIMDEKYKILITIISVISILSGCIIYKYYLSEELNAICENYLTIIQTGSFIEIFLTLIKIEVLFYIIIFSIGTTMLGTPIVMFPIIIKCIIIGYFSSYIYATYEIKGILFCLVLLYPYLAITTTTHIIATNESIYMSKYVLNLVLNKKTADDISLRLYLIRYFILVMINLICVIVNSFIIKMLGTKIILQIV